MDGAGIRIVDVRQGADVIHVAVCEEAGDGPELKALQQGEQALRIAAGINHHGFAGFIKKEDGIGVKGAQGDNFDLHRCDSFQSKNKADDRTWGHARSSLWFSLID